MGDDETGESLRFCPISAPLHCAAFRGDTKALQQALRNGEDVNMIQCTVPPLYVACMKGHKPIVEQLVKFRCDVNATSVELHQTGLHCAASKGLEGIVKVLIRNGAGADRQDSYGATPLFLASQYGHSTVAKCLVEGGADINMADRKGLSPLAIATLNGRVAVAQMLIKKQARLDQQDKQGNTALFHAVKSGQREICQVLTKAGAKVNIPNNQGDMPINIAAMYGNVIMVENLIAHGCDVNGISPSMGGTPVFSAVQRQHVQALAKLISAGADVRKTDGKTVNNAQAVTKQKASVREPVLKALQQKNKQAVVTKQSSTDCDVKKNDSRSAREPLLEALHQNNTSPQVILALLSAGSDIDVSCDCHQVPLHAVLSKHHGLALTLLMLADAKVGDIPKDKLDKIEVKCPVLYRYLSEGDQPLKLKAYCRKAIKRAVGSVFYAKKVEQIKLPRILRDYLLYREIQLPKLEQIKSACEDI